MRIRLILVALITLFAAANVSATRLIRFDQGDGFSSGGAIWEPIGSTTSPTTIDLSVFPDFEAIDEADGTDDPIDFPTGGAGTGFSVNYGTGLQTSVNILTDGSITFGAINPATNVAAPLLSGVAPAEIQYAKGLVIPDFVFGDTAALNDAVNAFRVTWFVPSGDPFGNPANFAFQVVLLDRSDIAAGDFDMEFNYEDFSGALAPTGSTAGFQLGTNIPGFSWPFTQDGSQTFQFRSGVLVATSIPEPNSLPLVLAGLMLIAAGMYRRRFAPHPAR